MKTQNRDLYEKICSFENLHLSYLRARKGKRYKNEILHFGSNQEELLLELREELLAGTYRHGEYREFIVCDSKKRHIKAAPFRDRIVHHALCNVIEPLFDRGFIFDSYACRKRKGTTRAVSRAKKFLRSGYGRAEKVRGGYVLKCDVSKYFDNVDHSILLGIMAEKITDEKTVGLIKMIIESSRTSLGKGIPIGNLTSQLFANAYLNELDQFLKRKLRQKKYIRYMDDFLVFGNDKRDLASVRLLIFDFLKEKLFLSLHPKKTNIHPVSTGVDFLGYVLHEKKVLLRKSTVGRFVKRMKAYEKMVARGFMEPQKTSDSVRSWVVFAKRAASWRLRKKLGEAHRICLNRPLSKVDIHCQGSTLTMATGLIS